MTGSKFPLALRLVFWVIIFSFVPLLVVSILFQTQVRQSFLSARLETMEAQARLYAFRTQTGPEDQQIITLDLNKTLPGNTFFLLGTDGIYIAHSNPEKVGTSATADLGPDLSRLLLSRTTISYLNDDQDLLLASYRTNLAAPVAVILSKLDTRVTPIKQISNTLMTWLGFALLGVVCATGVVMYLMLNPARKLSEFATQIGTKNFFAELTPSKFKGELGLIADSLMELSKNIQSMMGELEHRIVARTSGLEKRANQLKAAAEIGKAIASVRSLTELLQPTTQLIADRFGYYHVGIFILDERKAYAVLNAANSEGGRKMMERNHKLKVGETGIVGYVAENLKARIVLDVGQDAVLFDNPDLPATRSEMALPLVASGQALGVLDVQSREPQAFTEEDVATLQTLADQLAVAIENVNLYNETQKALETARLISGDVSRNAWRRIIRNQPRIGYIATLPGAVQSQSETMEPSMAATFEKGEVIRVDDGVTMSLPIKIRGEVIGAIRLRKSEISEAWTQEEYNLAISLSDQLSGALESARLYRESQQRAVRESLVSDISARLSASSRVEAIVRETVQELGQAIGDAKVTFQLESGSPREEQNEESMQGGMTTRKNGRSKQQQ